ncbi:MAG: hypothetical protein AAGF24_02350 [Cyanobacteria bacterium P01_H01_bin.121]
MHRYAQQRAPKHALIWKVMNLPLAIALVALGATQPAQASPEGIEDKTQNRTQQTQLVAGFGISVPGRVRVDVDIDDDDDDNQPASSGSSSSPTPGSTSAVNSSSFSSFSGNSIPYLDDFNGFKVDVPTEYKLEADGQSTNWSGPILDGGAVSIYVNAAPLPGVSPQTLQQTYRDQYLADRFYTDVVTTTVPYGNTTVPALFVKEVDNRRGSREQKAPDDIHRWHLFVFGNERVYTWGFTGMFETFQTDTVKIQDLYRNVISSVELIPIVE